jgi:hypothetical protein
MRLRTPDRALRPDQAAREAFRTGRCNVFDPTVATAASLGHELIQVPRCAHAFSPFPLLAALLAVGAGSTPAGRTAYPGKNGAIVFVSSGDLWTIRPDGSGLTRLTQRTGKVLRALTNNEHSTAPSWRPNGKQIAFAGSKGITVMTAAGKSPLVLARGGRRRRRRTLARSRMSAPPGST